ncbi:tripartite tricarboxylate transporter substrate binding protein [Pigmentiphaga sp. YJ18]|uniref:Bug family tripartite tricarboxylate transporter substrate binding protein n=1 Tax=Pigmentiphaga sp. YJ18 TaxID=3134907 RepID=UPI003110049D
MKKAWLVPLLSAAILACSLPAHAQTYPVKPVKFIVPYPPGGTTDVLARAVAKALFAKWNQPVVIENHGGAGGNIGAEMVYRADPDGYTLLFASPGPLAINKDLYAKVGYEPEKFAPISIVADVPNVLVTGKRLKAQSVQALIELARKEPGKLNYASQGNGSTSHLSAEMLKSMAGINIVHVPYKGSSPALTGLISGETDMMFVELSSVLQHIRAGTLRPLAVAGERRDPLLPDVPAMSEQLPGFVSTTWFAMVAPPRTPQAVVDKLSGDVAAVIKTPELAKLMADINLQAGGTDSAQTQAFLARERERWSKVIRMTGAQVE